MKQIIKLRCKLCLAIIIALVFSGCSKDNLTQIVALSTTTPSPEQVIMSIYQHYWVTANPLGNGKYGYYIGVSEQPGGVVSESFNAGTNVILLAMNKKYCKVEGSPSFEDKVIQGWIDCERLINFEPTPVPDSLYIHAP